MKTDSIYVGHPADRSEIYKKDGKIWYYSYWTDGHKDSLIHKIITAEEASRYANEEMIRLNKEKQNLESSLRSICRQIEKVKVYL